MKPTRESQFLKQARKDAGLTQGFIAKKLGYGNAQIISNIERSYQRLPDHQIKDFCRITGADPEIAINAKVLDFKFRLFVATERALWVVSKKTKKVGRNTFSWCVCKCGVEKWVRSSSIFIDSFACGSCSSGKATHRASNSRLDNIWAAMKQRCYYKKSISYRLYGARGIKVCDKWKNNSSAFMEWAKENGYADNLSIDRINVNGNYEPSNCRWATIQEQNSNQRTNIRVTYKGRTMILKDWCRELGRSYDATRARIYNGDTPLQALEFEPRVDRRSLRFQRSKP